MIVVSRGDGDDHRRGERPAVARPHAGRRCASSSPGEPLRDGLARDGSRRPVVTRAPRGVARRRGAARSSTSRRSRRASRSGTRASSSPRRTRSAFRIRRARRCSSCSLNAWAQAALAFCRSPRRRICSRPSCTAAARRSARAAGSRGRRGSRARRARRGDRGGRDVVRLAERDRDGGLRGVAAARGRARSSPRIVAGRDRRSALAAAHGVSASRSRCRCISSALVAAPAAICSRRTAATARVDWQRARSLLGGVARSRRRRESRLAVHGRRSASCSLRRRARRARRRDARLACDASVATLRRGGCSRCRRCSSCSCARDTIRRSTRAIRDARRARCTSSARRQYDVAGLWPRQAPVWLQLANWFEYADWQFALSLGPTVIPNVGARRWRRSCSRRSDSSARRGIDARDRADLARACSLLFVVRHARRGRVSQPQGGNVVRVAVRAGRRARTRRASATTSSCSASGRGDSGRAWARIALARALRLAARGSASSSRRCRSRSTGRRSIGATEPEASLPREVARQLLEPLPPRAVLFVAGDNDTYPLWYAQQVEDRAPRRHRRDAAAARRAWYVDELERRYRLSAPARCVRRDARRRTSPRSSATGRPVAAALTVEPSERAAIGETLEGRSGLVAVAEPEPSDEQRRSRTIVSIDTPRSTAAAARASTTWRQSRRVRPSTDPVHEYFSRRAVVPALDARFDARRQRRAAFS